MRIGIAGAGLLGRLLATQLAHDRHSVDVFDPAADVEARGAAGWTAAGMLSPVAELECADEAVFSMGLRSLVLWPKIIEKLNQPVEIRQHGSLLVAHRGDAGAAARVIDLLRRKAPATHAPRRVEAAELLALEPAVQGIAHVWHLPCEGQIDTVQAMAALAAAATAGGVRWHWGMTVLDASAGALLCADGRHKFDWVFDVRGTGARPQVAVRGVRGEIFSLHAPGLQLLRPVRLLHPRHRVYLVPRAGDVVIVGASEIESEDRSPVSLRSTVELLAAAHSVVPELAEARLLRCETNLRPALPDNLPVILCGEGITRINGLFRHGWLLAPALVERALSNLSAAGSLPAKPKSIAHEYDHHHG